MRDDSRATPPVSGTVDPAFDSVGDVFRANFEPSDGDPGDLGAALCVIVDGRVVVDLWGGWADLARTRPWTSDTLVNAYSIGKAITSFTVLSLVADGSLDLDAPVATVWPEFGAHGKGRVTLREAMAHRAGVPGSDRPLPDDAVFEFETIASAVAATEPWWAPGTAHGYHVNTLGHVLGEPVRRVTGRTLGAEFRRRLAGPADADAWIGLPAAEHHRVAEIDFIQHIPDELLPHAGDDPLERMRRATYFNPMGLSGIGTVNTARWRSAEVPSTNLTATARGVARVFASTLGSGSATTPVSGGADRARPTDALPLLVPASIMAEATTTTSRGHDLVLDRPSHFGLGLMLHQEDRPIGISPASYGHLGNGGSLGFADPDADVAAAYVMNRPGDRWQVPRLRRLMAALRETLIG